MVYDEYDDLASAERIIIEPQIGQNKGQSDQKSQDDPNDLNGSNGQIQPSSGISKPVQQVNINAQKSNNESSKSVSFKLKLLTQNIPLSNKIPSVPKTDSLVQIGYYNSVTRFLDHNPIVRIQ